MMHCTMDDLLALRAGEASGWARSHAEGCAECQAELDALYQRIAQLKALPARRPARDRWPVVRDAVLGERRRLRSRWGAWSVVAAATVAGLLVFRPFGTGQANAADLASIKRESATLEQQLRAVDPDARLMSGRTAALAAALEDRIAGIDGELARVASPDAARRADELVKLWQQRVELMQQLVGVHITRASYVGL